MRKIFFILCIVASTIGSGLLHAQVRYTGWYRNQFVKSGDSIFYVLNNKMFFGFKDSVGTSVDTTSLSNRINLRLNISDTSTMLTPYLHEVDTTAMLVPYLHEVDTTAMLTPYVRTTKYGRAMFSSTVCYSLPGVVLTATSSVASVINTITYDMFWVESEIVLDQMALNVTVGPTGTAKMHLGIYNADTDWQPSGAALVDNTITISGGATGVVTQSISLTLPRGRYLIARNCNNTFTMRSWRGYPVNVGLEPALASSNIITSGTVASAYGALPSSTPWTAVLTGGDHPIILRVSTP